MNGHKNKEQALQLLSQNRELTLRLFKAQESERGRLAQELHDELGQWLTAVNLYAHTIANLATDKSSEIYASATKITNSTTQMHNAIRSIIHQLRPQILDELGLGGGLHDLVTQWQLLHPDTICELAIHYEPDNLDETAKITIYRIVQESLTNAAKYAQANNVSIQLRGEQPNDAPPYLILTIKDDGNGIDLSMPSKGMGLAGMQGRALAARGEFLLTSEPGKGTHIEVRLPIESGEE
ncbi:MAG: sensor histidine kinase [Gallionellaceae bacterium]|nr:sensor histidine kinase [Gallionellaceae bacterium]